VIWGGYNVQVFKKLEWGREKQIIKIKTRNEKDDNDTYSANINAKEDSGI